MTYLEQAIAHPFRGDEALQHVKSTAAQYLDDIGKALSIIRPPDRFHETMLVDILQQYQRDHRATLENRQQSEGAILLGPLIAMLVAWMTLFFASFGYRAPRNPMVMECSPCRCFTSQHPSIRCWTFRVPGL